MKDFVEFEVGLLMDKNEQFLEFTQIVDLVSENENESDSVRCSND